MSLDQSLQIGEHYRIVAIGASAGGLEPLMRIIGDLPGNLPAAVLVVMHVPAHGPSALPRVLSRAGSLPAAHARDHEPLAVGAIRVAPPDHHLMVEDGQLRTVRGPRENRSRPAIDPLFRSLALAHGPGVIGVVLSGALDDGAAGLATIKAAGGVTIVQDPAEAVYADMPAAALRASAPTHRLPADRIGPTIARIAGTPVGESAKEVSGVRARNEEETQSATLAIDAIHRTDHPGKPSVFGCPDCGGTLWELSDTDVLRYRCRVGHAFTSDALMEGQRTNVEDALWSALRALEEQAALAERLAERADSERQSSSAERFRDHAAEMRAQSESIRQLLLAGRGTVGDGEDVTAAAS